LRKSRTSSTSFQQKLLEVNVSADSSASAQWGSKLLLALYGRSHGGAPTPPAYSLRWHQRAIWEASGVERAAGCPTAADIAEAAAAEAAAEAAAAAAVPVRTTASRPASDDDAAVAIIVGASAAAGLIALLICVFVLLGRCRRKSATVMSWITTEDVVDPESQQESPVEKVPTAAPPRPSLPPPMQNWSTTENAVDPESQWSPAEQVLAAAPPRPPLPPSMPKGPPPPPSIPPPPAFATTRPAAALAPPLPPALPPPMLQPQLPRLD